MHYNRAYATYQAALAEHKLAQSTYDDSIRTGAPFHFDYQFGIGEAYEDLSVATQGAASVNIVLPISRLLLALRSSAGLAGLCGLVLVIGIAIGAILH